VHGHCFRGYTVGRAAFLDNYADKMWFRYRSLNPANGQHAVLLLHLSCHLSGELPIAGINLTRFQHASESAHHSASRRRDNVVDCRGVWFLQFGWVNLIVLCDSAMHAVRDRLRLAWQMGMRKGPRLRSIVDFEI